MEPTDKTTGTENKNTEQTNVEPTDPESFKPPSTHEAVLHSPSILPQRTPLWDGVNAFPFPAVLIGLVRKATIPQPVSSGKSKSTLQTTSSEGEEEVDVQRAQGRKRGPDEPPPKSRPPSPRNERDRVLSPKIVRGLPPKQPKTFKILSINVRGLGDFNKSSYLFQSFENFKPDVIFMKETMASRQSLISSFSKR